MGALIAFPLGMMVGAGESQAPDRRDSRREDRPAPPAAPARDSWSPRIANDPYVIEQQRRVVEALELSCRQFKSHCAEARQARLRIEEAEASR